MAGRYEGVQTKISTINYDGHFIPCSDHSLNLSEVHTTEVAPDVKTFSLIVQEVYKYFLLL